MAYCLNCGQRVEDGANRCPVCGGAVPSQPVPAYIKPTVSVKARVLGYVGMGLGIEALIVGALGLFCVLLYLLIAALAYVAEGGGMGVLPVFMGIYFGLIAIPEAVVGRILCKKGMAEGNTAKSCTVGFKLSAAALIVSIVMVMLGLCGLFLM